ncbi:MAG: poly-gamma-glutamate biosynthesis protein PgsC [Candidatus Eisenbacteria sp.]|nr:poly-gamma-glutamate biosynthesis protein PgsC [Candidatus Eisenbacteria bacterium]
MIYEAIGLGLITSLLFSEALGLTAGGLIVPGYIALYLDNPMRIIGTLLAGIVTMVIVRAIGRIILLYGRRTMVFCVIVGFLVGYSTRFLLIVDTGVQASLIQAIGYIIPGLIAYWMVRQGVVETICTLLMSSIIVRLVLILVHGGNMISPSGI